MILTEEKSAYYVAARKKGSEDSFQFVKYEKHGRCAGGLSTEWSVGFRVGNYACSEEIAKKAQEELEKRGFEVQIIKQYWPSGHIDLDGIIFAEGLEKIAKNIIKKSKREL